MHAEGNKIVLTLDDLSQVILGTTSSASDALCEFASNLLKRNSIDINNPASTVTIPYTAELYAKLTGAVALGQQVSDEQQNGV